MTKKQQKTRREATYLILHNIRSAQNVGAMFRTADAAGISEMVLSGYTPAPLDRFGREQGAIAKTALGAEKGVPWRKVTDLSKEFRYLKKKGVTIVGVEQVKGAIDYKKLKVQSSIAFIFGNEVRGLSSQTLKKCDTVIHIPMLGKKESLNVATAAGIVLFRTLNI